MPLFRVIGFDYFTSYQLLFICMTVLGYAAWLVLLRRALRLEHWVSPPWAPCCSPA